jgi:hypothetical protein
MGTKSIHRGAPETAEITIFSCIKKRVISKEQSD